MAQTSRRHSSRSTSDTYTLAQLGRHWRFSRQKVVERLCDEDTGVPVFYDTRETPDDVDRHGRRRSLGGAKLLRVINLAHVRNLFTDGGAHDVVFLPTDGSDNGLQVGERRTLQQWLRVKRADVEGYDNRPWQEAKVRKDRSRGGKARVAQRQVEADLHRRKATEIRNENPEQSARLIAEAIAAECQRDGRGCKSRTIERHLRKLTQ